MNSTTKVVSAAIKWDGKIYAGRRHCDVISGLIKERVLIDALNCDYGFLTNEGRFVDRFQASKIALEAGQIQKERVDRQLYSEDLNPS